MKRDPNHISTQGLPLMAGAIAASHNLRRALGRTMLALAQGTPFGAAVVRRAATKLLSHSSP